MLFRQKLKKGVLSQILVLFFFFVEYLSIIFRYFLKIPSLDSFEIKSFPLQGIFWSLYNKNTSEKTPKADKEKQWKLNWKNYETIPFSKTSLLMGLYNTETVIAQSAGAAEYTDCFSAEG